jgi:hypothetical protein
LQVPCPQGYHQAENRDSRKEQFVGNAAQAHRDNLVYRTLRHTWQSSGIAEVGLHFRLPDYKTRIIY